MGWLLEPGVLATLIIGAGLAAFLALLVGVVMKLRRR